MQKKIVSKVLLVMAVILLISTNVMASQTTFSFTYDGQVKTSSPAIMKTNGTSFAAVTTKQYNDNGVLSTKAVSSMRK